MDGIYLCLDVGGTEIKAAPADGRGTILQPIRYFPSKAKTAADVLLPHFNHIANRRTPEDKDSYKPFFAKISPAARAILQPSLA